MNDEELKAFFEANLYTHVRKFDDGWAGIFHFIHTWGICTELDMSGYHRRYCYTSEVHAASELARMKSLDDVPEGWLRRLPEPFFLTIVGFEGTPCRIGQCLTERELLANAHFSQYHPEGRVLTDIPSAENMKKAMEILNQEGRALEIFRVPTEIPAFLERTTALGLDEEEARNVARSAIRW